MNTLLIQSLMLKSCI